MANGNEKKARKRNPYVTEEPKVRVQLSIEKRQVEWLQRKMLSPSIILRRAINQLMEAERQEIERLGR